MSDDADRTVSSGTKFELPGLEEATKQIKDLNDAISGLSANLKNISSSQGQHTSGINAITNSIGNMASAGGLGSYAPGPNYVAGGGGGDSDWMSNILSQGMGGGGLGMIASLATAPISYAYNKIEENRAVTRNLSYDLSRVSTMSGTGIGGILKMLAGGTPILGSPEEITGAMTQGAAAGFFNMNSPRSGSYYTGLRQMQQFTPAVAAPELAQTMNQTLGNTRAQQTAMMLTGGAMGNFGPGGVPKTLQEWAESTLRWFEGQRPGNDRGKAFTKEELASQVFPGSNMSAWFMRTGVSPQMQDYFWQYAMGKVQSGRDTKAVVSVEDIIAQRGGDLGLATQITKTAAARREFTMASQPGWGGGSFYDAYVTRESSDREFTETMRTMIDERLAKLLGGRLGELFAEIPTPIATFMMQGIQNLPGILGSIKDEVAGSAGTAQGGLLSKMAGKLGIGGGTGDPEFMIGDAGYGPLGGEGTAGMTPDMARRVSNMMRANPNIRIASGFRDGALQGKLHRNGVGMTAPAGHSMHGRGLAADLGPSSQYGWIAANAGRFGLQSGKKAGEPWHVGFPGTVPSRNFMIGDVGDLIGGIGSALNPANWWEGIQNIGSSVFDTIGGGLGGVIDAITGFTSNLFQGATSMLKGDWTALFGGGGAFDVGQMAPSALSGLFNLMGIPAGLNPLSTKGGAMGAKDFSSAFAAFLGSGSGGLLKPNLKSSLDWSAPTGGLGTGLGAAMGAAVTGSSGVAGIIQKYGGGTRVSPASVSGLESKIVAALQAAAAAGFKGDELVTIGAIAGRESTWNPSAHFQGPRDNSYGLWQINMLPEAGGPGRRKDYGITSDSMLFDPMLNARVAYGISGGGTNFRPWGKVPLVSAQQFVEPVYNIAKQHGFIGDPEYSPAYQAFGGPSGPRITVQNSINISAGGNSNPANLRRTAEQLAAFTSDEIYRQLARTT